MKEKLRGSDYRFIVICAALLGLTTWYSVRNFYRAFPEASIDFKVSRDDARKIANRFLSDQGYRVEVEGYRQAAQFTYDEETKTFLEREVGLERANRVMGKQVRLWRWAYRWYRPLQKEEYNVEITPLGQLAGFEHEVPEDAARPAASATEARARAENFLRQRVGVDPSELDFVESTDAARPHRTDRTFTWKKRDFQQGDASVRLEVTLLGNEVGGYREYLKVPEQWKRDYQRLRSKNEVASTIDTAFTLLLVVGVVVVIVLRVRKHDVPWKRAGIVGATAIVLGFLAQLNEFPLHEFSYPTTDSYGSFLSREFLNALLSALGAGGLLFVLTAGAEPLYREMFGGQVSLGNIFTLRGLRTKRFFLGSILGITLTGIFIAYQTAFYIVAYKYGAWSPDVPYTDLLNTRFPWAFVLFGGFLPAVSEEFLFRLFAIPFLRKVTRSMVAALILAGFIWGFGHAAYPQQPFYIRGVEVGIGGVALGIVMLRFGILPTLVWHYSVDAMYSAMLLVRSESWYFKLSGYGAAGIVLLPVLLALAAYFWRGGFEPATGLLNRDDRAEPETEPHVEESHEVTHTAPVPYQRLSTRVRWAAIAVMAAGAATLAIPVEKFGETPHYQLSRQQARLASDAFLKTLRLDPAKFQHVTYPSTHWQGADALAGKYFLERLPLRDASAMFERNRPMHVWVTRYFQSLNEEEITIGVHPVSGRVTGFEWTIPETRPGADLGPERAQQLAAQFAAGFGWDTGAMDLKESESEKKKARRDYSLEWEARPGDARNVGDARWRIEIDVSGDEVTSARGFWKLPEAWQRGRERENALAIALSVLRIATIAGLMVYVIVLLINGTRHGVVRWRAAIRLAIPACIVFPVAPLLSLGLMLREYRTDVPLETFQAMSYVTLGMSVLFGLVLLAPAAAVIVTFYPDALRSLARVNRGALAVDALLSLLATAGLAIGLYQATALLEARFHTSAILSVANPELIASAAPAIAAVTGAVRATLTDAALLGLIALLAWQLRRRWMLVALALLALSATVPGGVRTPGEFLLQYTIALLSAAAGVVLCRYFARRNYLAYALMIWLIALLSPLLTLVQTGNAALVAQGWLIGGVMAASVVWAVAPLFRRRTN